MGDADWYAEQQAEKEYQESPIVTTIKKLLEGKGDWSGTAQQLIEAGRYIVRANIAGSSRELSSKLKNMESLLMDYDGIAHERKSNGSGGGTHRFYYVGRECDDEDNPFQYDINGSNGSNGCNGCNGSNGIGVKGGENGLSDC